MLDIKDFNRFSFNQIPLCFQYFQFLTFQVGLILSSVFFCIYLQYHIIYFMCMHVCLQVHVCHVLAVCAESRRGHWIPCSGFIGHGEPPYRCWELSQGLLPEASAVSYRTVPSSPTGGFSLFRLCMRSILLIVFRQAPTMYLYSHQPKADLPLRSPSCSRVLSVQVHTLCLARIYKCYCMS